MKRRWVALAVLIGMAGSVVGGIAAASEWYVPSWLEHEARKALAKAEGWEGEIGSLDVDLFAGTVEARDVHVRATLDRMTLREVHVARAVYAFDWREVMAGTLVLRGTAISPHVVAGIMGPKPPREHPIPDPGWFRWSVESAFVDGRWTWTRPDGASHHAFDVIGRYDGIGSVEGPGELEAFGRSSAAATVLGLGRLDFVNAHRDAIDLHLRLRNYDVAGVQGMDRAYLQSELLDGRFDADVAFTVDKGLVQLTPPYYAGDVPDLDIGRITGAIRATGIAYGGLPIEPVEVDDVEISFSGPFSACDEPWAASANAIGLTLAIRRSQVGALQTDAGGAAAGATPPSEILELLPSFSIDGAELDGVVLRWIDDVAGDTVLETNPLQVHIASLHNLPDHGPSLVSLDGQVIGGALKAGGTLDLTHWPPPVDLQGGLTDGSAAELIEVLRPYLPSGSATGQLNATGSLRVDEQGVVTPEVVFDTSALDVSVAGWTGRLRAGHVDVFGGQASLRALDISQSSETSVFDRGHADSASITWDPTRLFDHQQVVAALTLQGPDLYLRRPAGSVEGGGGIGEVRQAFAVDLHARNGTMTWVDPLKDTSIVVEDLDADVIGLGTMTDRARWSGSGRLRRGGAFEGWAEIDAFAGPGADLEVDAHAALDGLVLDRWVAEMRAYAGIEGVEGQADVTVDVTPELIAFHADGRELAIRHEAFDVAAQEARATVTVPTGGVPQIVGTLVRADATVRMAGASSAGGQVGGDDGPKGTAWKLRMPHVELIDSRLTVITDQGPLTVEDTYAEVTDLSWPLEPARGDAEVSGTSLGGRLVASVRPMQNGHTMDVRAKDLDLAQLNPWLDDLAAIDLDNGRATMRVLVDRTSDGHVKGELRGRVYDLDVFQRKDWERGFFGAVREAAIGTLLHLADKDDEMEIVVPIDNQAPKVVNAPKSVLRSLAGRFGLRGRDDDAWRAFDAAVSEEAVSELTAAEESPAE